MKKSANVKGNLTIWTKQFKNLEELNLLKEEVEKTGEKIKILDSVKRELKQYISTHLKNPNNVCECLMA